MTPDSQGRRCASTLGYVTKRLRRKEEIRRRSAEIDAGKVEGVPAEDVFPELRQRFP